MPESRQSKRVLLKPISVPKSYDVLANHLRETILRGELSEGESLPPERELVIQTGLSRGSVREALRMLAVEGLVRTRQGRLGGNVVTLPGNESMANTINQFVRGRKLPLHSLQETRDVLEPALARLAAEHRTDDDVKTLKLLHEELIASVDNFQAFALANIKWHNAVARAGANELLAAFLYSISYGVAISTMTEEYDTMDTRNQVINIHALITDAIEARDANLAERRMRKHIVATHERATSPGTTKVALSDE